MCCRCITYVMFYCKISLSRLLAILVILVVFKVKYAHLLSYQSHLCEAKDMPCEKTNGDECRMKYYKLNSTECKDLAFIGDSKSAENDLGKVQIQSYHYNLKSYKQTGFNITFSNIIWNHLKFRFKQEGNEMKNTCREFYMSDNSTITDLFYDCLWSNENYEGKTFSFEYEATNGSLVTYKKLLFRVPFAKHIDETTDLAHWEIFIFVEVIKSTFGFTEFILHWQPLPERFSINTYNISVFSDSSGQSELTHFTTVTCNDIEKCKYHINRSYGNVQFGIQPICQNDSECPTTKTVVFLLGGESAKPLLIGIVSVSLIVPIMIYVLYLLRNYLIRKSTKWICPVPKLLIIFTPSLSYHVNVVFALVEYLKVHCNVEPLIDELHIFHSKSRDPFKWCNEAFKAADMVMVVASPYHKHLRLSDSVYQNTDVLLLRLLRERLGSREGRTKYFVLMLPYSSEKDIPSEAINLKRFSFPEDLNKMLRFIHRDSSLPACLSPEIQGGKENYKLLGTKLTNAIAETSVNLKKNKEEYDRIIAEMKNDRGDSGERLLTAAEQEDKIDKPESAEKRTVIELSEDIFGDYPGRLDDLNLSGEETVSLMASQRVSGDNEVVNLDVLEL